MMSQVYTQRDCSQINYSFTQQCQAILSTAGAKFKEIALNINNTKLGWGNRISKWS
jgi:hypothetical protein